MGCRPWDENGDLKLSLSRLTCSGYRSGDLTSCWDWSCQIKEQGFRMRRRERGYAFVYVSARTLSFWNLKFRLQWVCLLLSSPLWHVCFIKGHILVFPVSILMSNLFLLSFLAVQSCTFFQCQSWGWKKMKKCPRKLALNLPFTTESPTL